MLTRSMSVACALLAGLLIGILADAAWAQDAAATSADQPQLEEFVVTGSLIKRPNAETAEAISIVSADDLRNQGITTVEQALALISANQTNAYQTASAVTTFEGGGSFASLRGLGANKTLVLLDGQRLAVQRGHSEPASISIPSRSRPSITSRYCERVPRHCTVPTPLPVSLTSSPGRTTSRANWISLEPNLRAAGGGGTGANLTFGHGNVQADGYNLLVTGNYTYGAELRATQRPFSSTGFDPTRGLANTNNPGTTPGSYFDNNGNEWQVGYPACAGNPFLTRFYGDCAYEYSAAVDLIPKTTQASGLVEFTKALPSNNTLAVQYFYARSQVTTWGGPYTYEAGVNPGKCLFPDGRQFNLRRDLQWATRSCRSDPGCLDRRVQQSRLSVHQRGTKDSADV